VVNWRFYEPIADLTERLVAQMAGKRALAIVHSPLVLPALVQQRTKEARPAAGT